MDKREVEQRIKKVTSQVLGVPEDEIQPESRFAADLGAESIQSIQLVAAFEEEFGIQMDEEQALAVSTVGKAVDYICNQITEQKGK
jgi:acyl carrier protein